MVFKVYYQKNNTEVPIRENTKTLYIEAESEKDARRKLYNRGYNIEYVQAVKGAFLAYEQKSEHFKVLEN